MTDIFDIRTVPVVLLLILDGRENQHASGMYKCR